MTITPSYNPDPLAPEIYIYNLSDVLQYTLQTSATQASPTQDFKVSSLDISLGINSDYGSAVIMIDDPDNNLTDTTKLWRPSKIKRQWTIQIKVGKSNATLYRIFYGKIFEAEVIRPNTNLQQIKLNCVGWGVRLRDRQTSIKRFQLKTSDGLTLDTTDTNTRVSELAKDLVVDTDHYPHQGLSTESGITTTGVATIDVKLADLQNEFESWASVLDYLASVGKAVYWLDPDRDLYFNEPNAQDSGFLFTNDLSTSNLDSQNWSSTKIGYLFRSPFSYIDSTYEGGYSVLHGYGGEKITLDVDVTATNSTYTAHETNYIAIPITPNKDNITKIALKMSKAGTPDQDAVIQIIGQDGSGTPEETDLRRSILIPKTKLQSLTGTGTMTEIALKDVLDVVSRTQIFVVINKYLGSAGNEIQLDYQSATGTYYTSTDGLTWSSNTGRFAVRTYHSKAINVILENTVARANYGVREKVFTFRNKIGEESVREALIGASEVIGKEKRIYSDVLVSCPTDRVPLGKFCKIYDVFNGLEIKSNIVGLKLSMRTHDDTELGTNRMLLTLVESHY